MLRLKPSLSAVPGDCHLYPLFQFPVGYKIDILFQRGYIAIPVALFHYLVLIAVKVLVLPNSADKPPFRQAACLSTRAVSLDGLLSFSEYLLYDGIKLGISISVAVG